MEFGQLLARLWADSTTASAIALVVVVAILDLLTGISRAIASSQFDVKLVDVWVRTTIAGRVIPIVLVLLFGTVIGDIQLGSFSFNVLTAAAIAAAATFVAAETASIVGNLSASTPDAPPAE